MFDLIYFTTLGNGNELSTIRISQGCGNTKLSFLFATTFIATKHFSGKTSFDFHYE
jgi:hypothetical protein